METMRLFRLAPEAVSVSAHFVPREGWTLTVVVRRGDETFEEAHRETYGCLSTPELVDVLCADLSLALGL